VLKIKKAVKVKKVEKPKPEARKKDEDTGIVSGTKKAYTFKLVNKGYEVKKIIRLVTKKYPEAKETSIKIWIKRATK
jgi:hypothetical protein